VQRPPALIAVRRRRGRSRRAAARDAADRIHSADIIVGKNGHASYGHASLRGLKLIWRGQLSAAD
jgi:hypothetical protein